VKNVGNLEMKCPKCGNKDLNYFSVCFLVEAADGIMLEKLEQLQRESKHQTFPEAWIDRKLFCDETTIPKFLHYLKHKKTYPYAIRGQWIVLEVKHVTCQKCQTEVKPTRFGV
jgi:hypothetical protein